MGDVCFRLIVVVVTDKILNSIVGEKLLKLGAELCRKRLVVREHQCEDAAIFL